MCHHYLLLDRRSDFVGSQGTRAGRRTRIFNRHRTLEWTNISFYNWSRRIIYNLQSSRIQNLNSEGTRGQCPTDKSTVPISWSSFKFFIQPSGEWKGDLHRTHFWVARSVGMESKKWPQENTSWAHLSVAWWYSSPRPLEIATGGPRLLKTTARMLGSASRAAHGNKIWRRVHW